jgi:regulator of Ty1 transposition protein 109
MAAHERLNSNSSIVHSTLADQLAKELPRGSAFKLYHISTPPCQTSPLHSAPPGEKSDRTYCESHFLTLSISVNSSHIDDGDKAKEVLVFAIEIHIYSTAYLTTIFVSKADSTGYLHLLNLPKGSLSPLKGISSTFLAYLVGQRRRQGIKSVVSLFARAQDQYLFPGSVENSGKHVLDDRGLIRWWCRVLDPLVDSSMKSRSRQQKAFWDTIRGYLIVPGLDNYESKSYLPKSPNALNINSRWTIGHPLKNISRHQKDVPPRCLIPHFPDDPKSRFLDELNDELLSCHGKSINGEWKSVKSLDQFWDMMAFRQECSAGRLVGFIWVVFEPSPSIDVREVHQFDSQDSVTSMASDTHEDDHTMQNLTGHSPCLVTSNAFMPPSQPYGFPTLAPKPSKSYLAHSRQPTLSVQSAKKKLSGPIVARKPRVKTETRPYWLEVPEKSPYYVWPQEGRGQVVVMEKDYKRVTELLLRLDFANLDLAVDSTRRWISEVRSGVSSNVVNEWGSLIIGTKVLAIASQSGAPDVTTLNVGLVRKKRKGDEGSETASSVKEVDANAHPTPMNILGASVVRKKAKT